MINCVVCKETLPADSRSDRKYCSKKCSNALWYKHIPLERRKEYSRRARRKMGRVSWAEYLIKRKWIERKYQGAGNDQSVFSKEQRQRLKDIRYRATREGLPFNLDIEDITPPELCPIFGIPLLHRKGKRGAGDNSPSVDRIIPEKGYVKGNVVVISNRANRIKQDATIEELEKLAAFYRKLISSTGGLIEPTKPSYQESSE